MLDDYIRRSDVLNFIKEIKSNERYFKKEKDKLNNHLFPMGEDLGLFIFYDALIKYKIVLDDIYLFDEYLEHLEKIYKKFDDFVDVRIGINKLIGKMISTQLGIKDINSAESREKIITQAYNRYIKNGYFIHGTNPINQKFIQENGVIPGAFNNYQERFQQVNEIFAKYNAINIIDKDFDHNKVYFTDDVVKGCYYSSYAPMFFYQFLTNEEYFGRRKRKDAYLKDDYDALISPLKRFMSNNLFNESDKNFVLSLVKDEWDLLHREKQEISLLFVKKSLIYRDNNSLRDFLMDESDVYDVVDRILSSKRNNVFYDKEISSEDIEFLSLESFYEKEDDNYQLVVDDEEEYYKQKEEKVNREFLDVYGKVSILILLGSLFISLGVIISIFMILRG